MVAGTTLLADGAGITDVTSQILPISITDVLYILAMETIHQEVCMADLQGIIPMVQPVDIRTWGMA